MEFLACHARRLQYYCKQHYLFLYLLHRQVGTMPRSCNLVVVVQQHLNCFILHFQDAMLWIARLHYTTVYGFFKASRSCVVSEWISGTRLPHVTLLAWISLMGLPLHYYTKSVAQRWLAHSFGSFLDYDLASGIHYAGLCIKVAILMTCVPSLRLNSQ